MLIEVCVDTAAGLQAAIAGGADRIELCSALAMGGVTPSAGFMAMGARCGAPVMAMIRPRAGDFVFSTDEVQMMLQDIAQAKAAGLAGVVIGASKPDGRLCADTMARLVQAAGPMDITLHRAFDLVPDRAEALELAVSLGTRRILTSGRALRAVDGLDVLRADIAQAAGRIAIMPGAGVNAANAVQIAALGVREIHASCGAASPAQGDVARLGFAAPEGLRETSADLVRALRASLPD